MTTGLRPRHDVTAPHADIREGRLGEAVFATNAWAVVQGNAPEVYLAPEELFHKPFKTAASRRCCGKWPGLTLWRLGRHAGALRKALSCENVRRELGGRVPDADRPVAVFTNRTCDAAQICGPALNETVRANRLSEGPTTQPRRAEGLERARRAGCSHREEAAHGA